MPDAEPFVREPLVAEPAEAVARIPEAAIQGRLVCARSVRRHRSADDRRASPSAWSSVGGSTTTRGPDVQGCARVEIDGLLWAGDVEVHTASSAWEAHGHDPGPRLRPRRAPRGPERRPPDGHPAPRRRLGPARAGAAPPPRPLAPVVAACVLPHAPPGAPLRRPLGRGGTRACGATGVRLLGTERLRGPRARARPGLRPAPRPRPGCSSSARSGRWATRRMPTPSRR